MSAAGAGEPEVYDPVGQDRRSDLRPTETRGYCQKSPGRGRRRLACGEALFERLKGDEQIPPFEKPEPPKSEDFLEWQKPLPGHQVFTNPYHDSLSDNLNVQVEATARELEERRERLKAG